MTDTTPEKFQKKKEWLFCIDSDGCAMDTMDIKHIRCFGPCLVKEWGLSQWEKPILKWWNETNLYSMTRGINRFKGLALALLEIDRRYCRIEGIETLEKWTRESPELSNQALGKAIAEEANICLKKALSWSEKVNESIDALSFDEKRPFEGVKEALAYANQYGDVAIVSSANRQAVVEEWEYYGLLDHVDLILAQDFGSKEFCIRELLKKGYEEKHVLMVGDAPGDREAAERCGVFFYPIVVRREKESWKEFMRVAVEKMIAGSYGGVYQREKEKAFFDNLKQGDA